jgi:4-hydroxy-tetrahydrodipicolinate reductase
MGSTGIRAVVYGVGAMGALCGRLMHEKGVELVGGITRTSHLGEDLGEVCGVGALGVQVGDDAEAVLAASRPDVALVCVATFMDDMTEHLERCVRHGVNVITTAEEALYPWRTQPELTARLDALAKANGVSVLGSGYTDYYWGGEVMQLAGSCHRIERIDGVGRFNVDDYGIAVARNNHVGEGVAEFRAAFEKDTSPAFFQTVADLLCADLGLSVTSVGQSIRPSTEDVDVPCAVLGMTVRAGDVTGKVTVVDVATEEGVDLHIELQERLYREGETDLNRWVIHGEPDAVLENPSPATDVLTCATMVNRIPDIIAAPPGIVTVDTLPKLRYRAHPLPSYLG